MTSLATDAPESWLFVLRNQRVMLSTQLAELHRVEPRALVQAVKRNIRRFRADFMFQLTWEEIAILKSQSVISSEPSSRPRSQIVILKRGGKRVVFDTMRRLMEPPTYGAGRWRKLKGLATIRLRNGRIRRAELHWYEAHGIGRRDIKRKRYISES